MFAQVVGRHAACNLAAFGCLAGPGGRWQPVVANAGTLPLSCGGLLAGQSVFGNFNFCVLHLLVRLACRKVSFLQDTCMANLSWFCRYSGPSHFTKT